MSEYYVNKKEIDIDKLIDCMLDESLNRFFLNTKTGKIKTNPSKKEWKTSFFEVQKVFQGIREMWLKDYIEDIVPMEKPNLAKEAKKVFKDKGYQEARRIVNEDKDFECYNFSRFEKMPAFDFAIDWLETLPFEFEDVWEYDCDCALCMAMEKADKESRELNYTETMAAFKETGDLQAQGKLKGVSFVNGFKKKNGSLGQMNNPNN
jgi:hypothetical protein